MAAMPNRNIKAKPSALTFENGNAGRLLVDLLMVADPLIDSMLH
jgi:hypothetical protein